MKAPERTMVVRRRTAEILDQWSGKTGYVTKEQLQYFRSSFYDPMAKVKQSFSEAYDKANLIVQRQTPIHGELHSAMIKYQCDLLYLERRILEVEAFTLSGPSIDTSYVKREIDEALSKEDNDRLRAKQTIFFRADPEGNQLLRDLLTLSDDKEVDRKFGQLIDLSGFDYEIYDKIPGNLDLLLFHVGEKIGILVETTKQQPSKQKVDQVAARTKEYTRYLTALLGGKPSIYPLLVTTNEKPEINKEARFDAVTNEVAIFTSKHIQELVNLLKKGKLNRKKVVDMIRKSIPT